MKHKFYFKNIFLCIYYISLTIGIILLMELSYRVFWLEHGKELIEYYRKGIIVHVFPIDPFFYTMGMMFLYINILIPYIKLCKVYTCKNQNLKH